MNTLIKEPTAKTPKVFFDADKGIMEITGRSIPEDAISFYTPLYNWINEYKEIKPKQTVVNIQLEYFNSSSSKCIIEFFKKMEEVAKVGADISVNWRYQKDDEDIHSAGEDIKSVIKLPFRLVEVK